MNRLDSSSPPKASTSSQDEVSKAVQQEQSSDQAKRKPNRRIDFSGIGVQLPAFRSSAPATNVNFGESEESSPKRQRYVVDATGLSSPDNGKVDRARLRLNAGRPVTPNTNPDNIAAFAYTPGSFTQGLSYQELKLRREEERRALPQFSELSQAVKLTGTLTINNHKFTLKEVDGAYGDFVQIYRIASDDTTPQIVPDKSNEEVAVKVFHTRATTRNQPKTLMGFMESSLQQYKQLLAINAGMLSQEGDIYPVAKIWNADSATKDLFYIVEYIPYAVDVSPWEDPLVMVENLDEKSQKILHSVRRFMELMDTNRIVLDPKPNNFRLDEAGNLYLVDFTEEPDEDDLTATLDQCIRLWSGDNQYICDFLKANIKEPIIREMLCEPKFDVKLEAK